MLFDHAIQKVHEQSCSPRDAYELVLLEEGRFRSASVARTELSKIVAAGQNEADDVVAKAKGIPRTVVEASPPARQPEAPAAEDPAGGPSVLLVEDDPVSQSIAQGILEKDGFEVVTANDGVEALLAIGQRDFDVIVSDMNMPNLDGLTLLEMLVSKGLTVPVLFLTSETGAEVEAMVLGAGAADFIRKPIVPTILLNRVQNVVGRRVAAAS